MNTTLLIEDNQYIITGIKYLLEAHNFKLTIAKNLMDNTLFFKEELKKLGYKLIVEPELNLVSFNHPDMDTKQLASELEARNWRVSISSCPIAIRVVLMNHIKKEHLKELLKDLKEIY